MHGKTCTLSASFCGIHDLGFLLDSAGQVCVLSPHEDNIENFSHLVVQ